MTGDDDTDNNRQPVDRRLREEFDGIKTIRPSKTESQKQRAAHARKASQARWTRFREEDDRRAGPRQDDGEAPKEPLKEPGPPGQK